MEKVFDMNDKNITTVFICGAITNNPMYKEQFNNEVTKFKLQGLKVLSPTMLPDNLNYEDYFPLTFAMIDIADCIFVLKGSSKSNGANREIKYAQSKDKFIIFEDKEDEVIMIKDKKCTCSHHKCNEQNDNKVEAEDMVNHPKHYTSGKYECIEEMELLFGKEAVITYCKLAAYKYKHRADLKGKKEEDLKKCDWYLSKIEALTKSNSYKYAYKVLHV